MKIIVTIIPTDLVTNSLLSTFFSFLTNQNQEPGFQQVDGLVTRNISVHSESHSTLKSCRIQ